ncbi:eukaryotic translation initiation factor 4A1 [Actinidia rufa]|uniref:Eukaryotic translation initiation factor 4A1 n=1 Tax=Actinidia rufa TaxID=165716 RepID=A0A7J0GBP3_9ERIC|nr:eukaryotic translation initiation factor 4A1 [Actinidia rufa]
MDLKLSNRCWVHEGLGGQLKMGKGLTVVEGSGVAKWEEARHGDARSGNGVMAGLAPEGSQFDARQYDAKMNEILATDGQDFFTSYDDVCESFDAMGLLENLLRGIYAYGNYLETVF